MADALQNAKDGQYSKELDTLSLIDRFGIKAILGRDVFYFGELQKMLAAENIHYAYHTRKRAKSWAEFANDHPKLNKILNRAETLNGN